ncbi:nucleotide excision repair endonuclease [Planococcus sp. N028]|uniref:Nucleotide excision repair endonuclease n=1 Tax=Planococcus shixiaomingii TaxID=3058393 RepID=A0ABT8N5U8_9BACL|nr:MULTISPECIES: nucleotide excision repair endonuclease [unclassified Planococcus (in: firmicutes)]MDN7243109.1 nucleotide excision repair endonuclease [Planococcus sp. N028]WKA56690.1 nucleotide excision repair endonuclease [Planococcus sp. N022]
MNMIKIQLPKADVTITQRKQEITGDEAVIKPIVGFIDLHEIPRDKGGIIQFFNHSGELLFVGKARKLRQRVKKHLEDTVSPLKNHREEIHHISVTIVEDPMERDIYETYLINTEKAKYNVDKVFYKD